MLNSYLQAYCLQVKSQDAVHTMGSQCVYISKILKPDHLSRKVKFQDFTLGIAKTVVWGKFNGGITICLDTYCDINSICQHNCLYYTR